MRFSFFLITLAVVLSGCSGSSRTTVDDTDPRPPTMSEILQRLPEYETFDEASYPTEPPVVDVVIEHDVPEELMAGSVGQNNSGTRSGWRIQLFFAREKSAADDAMGQIHNWLAQKRSEIPQIPEFQQNLPVYNVYLQPYFRVRIGDFRTRDEAESLLQHMLDDYPRAFVMVDQINR